MRPPPRSIEEWLYRYLIDSPTFNHYVRKIHARINGISMRANRPTKTIEEESYQPTLVQKANAFKIIWLDEFKNTFFFWKRR